MREENTGAVCLCIILSTKVNYEHNKRAQSSRGAGGPDVREKVEEVLNKVRPFLQRDGGDVELVEVKDGVVHVRLTGACRG